MKMFLIKFIYFRYRMMSDTAAFTVTKENVEDDRALLNTGVIGTGTEVIGDDRMCVFEYVETDYRINQ